MVRPLKNTYVLFLSLFLLSGCVKLVLRFSPSLISDIKQAAFEECDPELARVAIPANIKLLEGLLKSDPDNRHLLVALCQALSGYSLLFVENDSPKRASDLYLRAREFGFRALGEKGKCLKGLGTSGKEIHENLQTFSTEDLENLFWVTFSWGAWVNLNLDQPVAIAEFPVLDACTERITELGGDYMFGLPWVLLGTTLSARPPLFGGDLGRAKSSFERALSLSRGKFFLAQYYYAKYYAVRVQDRSLFHRLLQDIVEGDPQAIKDVCLINRVIQQRAIELKEKGDDLFL